MLNMQPGETNRGSRKMTERELQDFLKETRYGTIAFLGADGWPDMRPLNLAYYNGCFYFHAHRRLGEKLRYISNHEKVCVNVIRTSDRVGEDQLCLHHSVLAYGSIDRIDGIPELEEETWGALTELCWAAGTPYKANRDRLSQSIHGISVFRITPEHMVGKIVVFTSLPSPPTLKMDWGETK